MRVMAFAAHPDDELVCAGTLAKYAAKGHKVAIVFITNGEVGSEIYGNEEIARIRKEEARASLRSLEPSSTGSVSEMNFSIPTSRYGA